MTTTTTNIAGETVLKRFARTIASAIERNAYQMSRRDLIEQFEAKSDQELAQLGIKRSEISQYVFRDLFYA